VGDGEAATRWGRQGRSCNAPHFSYRREIEANQRLKAASEPTQAPQARSRQSPGVDDRLKPLRRPLKRLRTPQYRYDCPRTSIFTNLLLLAV
jgi:hypothetical protein